MEELTHAIECESCHRSFAPNKFYKTKTGVPMKNCKGCVAAMIDINNSSTFEPFLKECDYPYIPGEWNKMVNKYQYTIDKHTGMQIKNPKASQIVFSNYIKRFRLPTYRDLSYADTPRFIEQEKLLQEEREKAVEKDMENIKENIDSINMTEEEAKDLLMTGTTQQINGTTLSNKESRRLKVKWGAMYSENDLLKMETLYQEMHTSFEINTASHEDYLKKIVKTSVLMDDMLEQGNYDEYARLSKIYDQMMKSAKFTASQETESEDFIDSIGELAYMCEEKGFIPRFDVSEAKDVVDTTLKDLTKYTHDLVIGELNLDSMVETALQAIEKEEEQEDNLFDEDDSLESDAYLEQILEEVEEIEDV